MFVHLFYVYKQSKDDTDEFDSWIVQLKIESLKTISERYNYYSNNQILFYLVIYIGWPWCNSTFHPETHLFFYRLQLHKNINKLVNHGKNSAVLNKMVT